MNGIFLGVDIRQILHFVSLIHPHQTPEQRNTLLSEAKNELERRIHISPAQKRAEYDSLCYRLEHITPNEEMRGMDEAWDMERHSWWNDMLHTCPEVIADLIAEVGTLVHTDQNGRIFHYSMGYGNAAYFRVYEYRGILLAHRLDYEHTAALFEALSELEATYEQD